MKVTCAECGEELMGAVNRCWRCGKAVVSRPGSETLPPVRRPPVQSTTAESAEIVILDDDASEPAAIPDQDEPADQAAADKPAATGHAADAAAVNAAAVNAAPANAATSAGHAPSTEAAAGGFPVPRGAAPASRPPSPDAIADRFSAVPRPAYYPKHAASTGGAVGAMVLAVMSLGFAYFTIGAVFTALLGIALGAWGVYSNHRTLAVTAMALCCLAVALAAIFGVLHLYTELNGANPFLPPPVSEFE